MCSMIHSTDYTTYDLSKKLNLFPPEGRFYTETDEIKYPTEGNLTISARVSLLVDS
jgi:hypothetical protein